MMAIQIQSFRKITPMIYAYSTPGVTYNEGWIKIGYTEKQTVEERIKQQSHTVGITPKIEWRDNALYKDGTAEAFKDRDFHAYLEGQLQVERRPSTEWFHLDGIKSREFFDQFALRQEAVSAERREYRLRDEQVAAVEKTKAYFEAGGTEFLWNAKPRFGKTLTAYDLIRQMGFQSVLIVTNRPSIANSWAEDFHKFIGWRQELSFVSETDALKGKPGVLTYDQYQKTLRSENPKGKVVFESLQGIKGSVYFGGGYDKLEWLTKATFDLLIIDEAHEGVETLKAERAFDKIRRKHTLHLSGTPFKALASAKFSESQIYNWSYADEQERKVNWSDDAYNPYAELPKMEMYTYQLSPMIEDQLSKRAQISEEETVNFAFDLNEFFKTKSNHSIFEYEDEVKRFLNALSTQEKYPFSTDELRGELSHTLWLLNRVDSARALAKLLKEDPVFSDYEIILAAGDGRLDEDEESEKAYEKVKEAIATHEKTITLSVGQLTVGVTIPEWSAVLMLCNLKSPASYMQAAFRAQNPCLLERSGKRYRKETAYVFDFDPARTLIIFDEFANNLQAETAAGRGTSDDRKDNIRRLLNFFPVLGEDTEGKMVELDAAQVLSIPRKLKSEEVVRKGFMSNFLFQNIGHIFGAPKFVQDILEQLPTAQEQKSKRQQLDGIGDIHVDDNGDVEVSGERIIGKSRELFGDKIHEEIFEEIYTDRTLPKDGSVDEVIQHTNTLIETMKQTVRDRIITPAVNDAELKSTQQKKITQEIEKDFDRQFDNLQYEYKQKIQIAKLERNKKLEEVQSESAKSEVLSSFDEEMKDALNKFNQSVQDTLKNVSHDIPTQTVERIEKAKDEEKKKTFDDEIRSRLRGFSRTIPSFIMAYGDENLTLQNFDEYTEDDVFQEVTGITEDDFRFLRDGGTFTNPETGMEEPFEGHLFDEVVFNDSIREFLLKKEELADYFHEEQEEDIFDYIPPQKNNQIFTPKAVVKHMVDLLEENDPGCFDDPSKTFADLYMKSGLYITEIVKRLYRNETMRQAIPDDNTRIRHILEHQVYGMAPSRIIYLIATNYIFGFDESLREHALHFVQADAAQASKDGTLEQLVEEHFGKEA